MKKKLLFAIDSLDCAGAEKSLVTLLGLLDYSKYDVDLMLFAHGKELEKLVPSEVNILKPQDYTEFTNLSIRKMLTYSLKNLTFKFLYARLSYSLMLRMKQYNNIQKARLFWNSVAPVIESNDIEYDVAISYAQGVPTFYIADKVKAKKKMAWVNVSYRLNDKERLFQKTYYDEFNNIVAVSKSTKDIFLENYPIYDSKTVVVHDINNPELINEMSKIGEGFRDNFDGLRILTIGRLARQKGYDIAIDTCRMLKERGIHFRWYVLGKGPLEEEIKALIEKHGLQDHFILLGVEPNPYPYIKNADIYVQTSKFEGFGIALAEARMLNIPIVTTKFDAVFSQMVDGKNGLVVDMNSRGVLSGILTLIEDHSLRESISTYQKNELKGNVEEVEKVYQLIG